MADTYDETADDLTDSEQLASSDFRALVSGARILKGIAGLAVLLWFLTAVFIFWTYWDIGVPTQVGDVVMSFNGLRFRQGMASALQGSWGWALVAVVAYLGSLLLRGQLARLWLDSGSYEEL
jgi:hypothetical protein